MFDLKSKSDHELMQLADTVDSYDKALAIKLDYHEAWYNRGNALAGFGIYTEAKKSLKKAFDIFPNPEYRKATDRLDEFCDCILSEKEFLYCI